MYMSLNVCVYIYSMAINSLRNSLIPLISTTACCITSNFCCNP